MNKPIKVSIVDDEVDLRENIAGYVDAAKGFRCLSVYSSAEEALAHLPKEKPDVVLMDINLGGMSGIECVRQLKPLMPETQVVMLTVFEDTEKIFSALAAGASGYLLKRLAPAKLLEAIREVRKAVRRCPRPSRARSCSRSKPSAAPGDETTDLVPARTRGAGRTGRGPGLQANRRPAGREHSHRAQLHPPHLRKTARVLAAPRPWPNFLRK